MKKRVFSTALISMFVLQSVPVFAAEYEATAYDVEVADALKVPFSGSAEAAGFHVKSELQDYVKKIRHEKEKK